MKTNLFNFIKTSLLFLSFICLMSSWAMTPQRAYASDLDSPLQLAQDTVQASVGSASAITVALTQVQNSVLNPLAWVVAKTVLQSVVKSTVNSINKGPNGSPQFATNLAATLQSVGDTAANSFISQLASNGAIRSPYQTAVASAVGNNYLQSSGNNALFNQNPFTLSQVSQNPTAFYNGDLVNGGGLNAWMSAWSNSANNPFGAAQLATNAVISQSGSAQSTQKQELSFGQGYLSSRGSCNTTTTGQPSASGPPGLGSLLSLSPNSNCQSKPILTPGSLLNSSVQKAAGSGIDTLVNSHTLGEIITSILGQLINQVVGPGGLFGTSQPSPSTGGSSYFNQTSPSQSTINSGLTTSFSSTVAGQITGLQQFQTEWGVIGNAALAAKSALSTTTCYPNAPTILVNTVQPVVTQATASLSQASAGITALQNIQSQITAAATSPDSTDAIANATQAYTALVSPSSGSSILPSASDISFAMTQSTDTGTSTPQSLLTEMNSFTQGAQTCVATPTTGT